MPPRGIEPLLPTYQVGVLAVITMRADRVVGTLSPFLRPHAPTDFAVHGWHSYQVPLARIELTVPDYETGAFPLSDKGVVPE